MSDLTDEQIDNRMHLLRAVRTTQGHEPTCDCAICLAVALADRLRSSVPGTTPRGMTREQFLQGHLGWAKEREDQAAAEIASLRAHSPGTTETGTREARVIEAARHLNAFVDFSESNLDADGNWGSGPPDDPLPMDRAWLALGAALRSLAALPVSRGEATRRECLWHADCDAADRALRTGVSPSHPPLRASPSPGSETPRGAEERPFCSAALGALSCEKRAGHGGDHFAWVEGVSHRWVSSAPSPSLPGDNHAEKEE